MILVDSCIILDIMTRDKDWFHWSLEQLEAAKGSLVINPIIYAEISIKIASMDELDRALIGFKKVPLPYQAAFLAGKAFLKYTTEMKGAKSSTLPDFFIGAHAFVQKIPLLTRDISRYQTYFPSIKLIYPEKLRHMI